MRMILLLPLILSSGCVASTLKAEPTARVAYADLALDSPAGRAELRQRVAQAARAYCREHEAEVTPQVLRNDRQFCLVALRNTIAADMPGAVRRAYARGLREAGVRGRQL